MSWFKDKKFIDYIVFYIWWNKKEMSENLTYYDEDILELNFNISIL